MIRTHWHEAVRYAYEDVRYAYEAMPIEDDINAAFHRRARWLDTLKRPTESRRNHVREAVQVRCENRFVPVRLKQWK